MVVTVPASMMTTGAPYSVSAARASAAVDKERTYLGGCILPGLRAGAALLQETAALLPSIPLPA